MIQIERRSGWNLEQINLISKDIKKLNYTTKWKIVVGIGGGKWENKWLNGEEKEKLK